MIGVRPPLRFGVEPRLRGVLDCAIVAPLLCWVSCTSSGERVRADAGPSPASSATSQPGPSPSGAPSSTAGPLPSSSATSDTGSPPTRVPTSDAARGGDAAPPDNPDDSVRVPHLFAPELVGALVGPASATPPGPAPYGTDLGWSFVHRGTQTMLFGDSMTNARFYCDNHAPLQDDSLATLPLLPPAGVPALAFVAAPNAPTQYATITVNRGGAPLPMGLARTPVTAWSDGSHAFAMFGHQEFTSCAHGSDGGQGCDAAAGLTCVTDVGVCTPALGATTMPCDVTTGQGCSLGLCVAPADGFCVDLTCSQYDGTDSSKPFAIARNTEIAMQRDGDPAVFDSVYTFASKKFHYALARTVTRLGATRSDHDFSPGTGALLIWGRPGFSGEHGRQTQLYLLKHTLPLPVTGQGTLPFTPQFFAGVDPASGEPRWSAAQREAVAISMDGKRNGSPSEPVDIVNQYTISWLGPPVNKWIMLYGGDVPDQLLLDPNGPDEQSTRGPLRVRFADFPWGPFSPSAEYLSPGSPTVAGTPYGPGGFLYHNACQDQPGAPCAKTDPVRPLDSYTPGCPTPTTQLDIGRLYGVNIIDAYTQPSAQGGLSITWNVSTWNPYGVVLMRSRVVP